MNTKRLVCEWIVVAEIAGAASQACKVRTPTSAVKEDVQSTEPAMSDNELSIDLACAEMLINDDGKVCNLIHDPMVSEPGLQGTSSPLPPDELTLGGGDQGMQQAELLPGSGLALDGQSNDLSCDSIRSTLGLRFAFLQVALGSAYSHTLMDAFEKGVWLTIDGLSDPTLARLAEALSSQAAAMQKMDQSLPSEITVILTGMRGMHCKELLNFRVYYHRAVVFSRVAQLANDLVRQIPFIDGGYRRNGTPRLVGRIARNIAVNREERGAVLSIYRRLRDRMINQALVDTEVYIHTASAKILAGTGIGLTIRAHDLGQPYYWLQKVDLAGKKSPLLHGALPSEWPLLGRFIFSL